MKRYISLDVLRGLTVTFMCIVNNPGSWAHVFSPLRHSPWNGCTPTDLVAPFFIFCAGCAMAFSFTRYDGLNAVSFKKLMKRGVLMFMLGVVLNMLPFFPIHPHDPEDSFWRNWIYWLNHVRIYGILQHIAVAYVLAGLIVLWLRKPIRIVIAGAFLILACNAVMSLFGTAPGPYTLEGNVSARIDVAIVGPNHLYHGYRLADGTRADFDPEGLMTCITGACTALLGYLIGMVILSSSKGCYESGNDIQHSSAYTDARIFVYGLLSMGLAAVLSLLVPVNKPLWTTSYVLYSGGWAMLVLAFLIFVIDLNGFEKIFRPFRIMGTNALMAFVLSAVFGTIIRITGFDTSAYFGANEFTSLLWALLFTLAVFICLWILYRKNIIIKL